MKRKFPSLRKLKGDEKGRKMRMKKGLLGWHRSNDFFRNKERGIYNTCRDGVLLSGATIFQNQEKYPGRGHQICDKLIQVHGSGTVLVTVRRCALSDKSNRSTSATCSGWKIFAEPSSYFTTFRLRYMRISSKRASAYTVCLGWKKNKNRVTTGFSQIRSCGHADISRIENPIKCQKVHSKYRNQGYVYG